MRDDVLNEMAKTMNAMFGANPYTDNGRVTVDYAPNCKLIVVRVLNKMKAINVDDECYLTDYGIMWEVMDAVKKMYDGGNIETIF